MAMADLARHAASAPAPLSAIAERQGLSITYLEQLFMHLRRAGLVASARGRAGGYRLGRPAREITIAAVMAAVDEGTRMTRCHGGTHGGCVGDKRCLTHGLWDALGDHIQGFLAGVTLQDVLDGNPAGRRRGLTASDFTVAAE
jgi:Rrf2 family protein